MSHSDFDAVHALVQKQLARRDMRRWLRSYVETTLRKAKLSFPPDQQRELREALGDPVRLAQLQTQAHRAYGEAEDLAHEATTRERSSQLTDKYFAALELMASVDTALYVLELPIRITPLELESALCGLATGLGISDQALVDRIMSEFTTA